jgi:hypothetical protein
MEFDTLTYTTASLITVWALENLCIFVVMFALIFISINTAVKEAINPPRPTPNQPAQLAPSGPQMVQGGYGGNLPQYTVPMQGQHPGMQPGMEQQRQQQQQVYAYQLPSGQQQQYYQQQPVYAQAAPPMQPMQPVQQVAPPQELQDRQYVQAVSPTRDINVAAIAHATQNKEVPVVSPATEKPFELPQAGTETELP